MALTTTQYFFDMCFSLAFVLSEMGKMVVPAGTGHVRPASDVPGKRLAQCLTTTSEHYTASSPDPSKNELSMSIVSFHVLQNVSLTF